MGNFVKACYPHRFCYIALHCLALARSHSRYNASDEPRFAHAMALLKPTRLWPNALFGRLMLVLFGGVLLAQLVSTAVFWLDREAFAFRGSAARAAQRVGDLVQILNQLPQEQRQMLARNYTGAQISFELAPPGRTEQSAAEEAELSAMLNQRLKLQGAAGKPIARVWQTGAGRKARYRTLVTAQLSDGTPLNITLDLSSRPRNLLGGMLGRLGILLLVMLVLTMLAVRWVIRPLTMLGDAADELGRNLAAAPIAERGPVEVKRAARAFNTMQERLRRYVRTREDVLAAMSHDLKTPITRLKLRSELLDEGDLKQAFVRDLDEMQEMVEATLQLMRGLDNEEAIQPVDLRALIESIVFDYEAQGIAIAVHGQPHAPLPAKPLALKRCLQNLIGNAVGFSKDVHIIIEDRREQIQISIIDHGPGIPEHELRRVFDPYYRVEQSRNRNSGGHGLGLSIAYNFAQQHGGTITLRNRAEGGLEALLILPR